MRKAIATSIFLLGVIALLSNIGGSQSSNSCQVQWVFDSDGGIPDGAVICGNEADGTPLYLARAHYSGGLHPGKVRPGFGSANIPYNGYEIKVNPYEVYCGGGTWVQASGGAIPAGAIVCGYDTNGEYLYAARAWYAGGLQLGKVRPEFGAANIAYGGREVKVYSYEVLCCAQEYPQYPQNPQYPSRPVLHIG